MKVLLLLLVLLGVAYYFFYGKGGEKKAPVVADIPASAGPAAPTPTPVDLHSFDSVTILLRQDLNAIPASIDGPGHPPANALAIKRKIRPYVNLHPEYQTLTQACDLIINADAQRNTLQAACRDEQTRTTFDNSLNHDTSPHSAIKNAHVPGGLLATVPAEAAQKAIHTRIEGSWSNYRAQTVGQVQHLLGMLAGKRL